MAGVYNSMDFGNQSKGLLQSENRKLKQKTKFLQDELHNKKMTIDSYKSKIAKLRNENSMLQTTASSNPDQEKKINELLVEIKNYKRIIQRLNNEINFPSILNDELKNSIENHKKENKKLREEKLYYKAVIQKLKNLFEQSSNEMYKKEETLNSISSIFGEFEEKCLVKAEPVIDLISFGPAEFDLLGCLQSYGRSREVDSGQKMLDLNHFIDLIGRCKDEQKKLIYRERVHDSFNTAQSIAFLYPFTTNFVTLNEKKTLGDNNKTLPKNKILSLNPNNNLSSFLVVEEHWPLIINEFYRLNDSLPRFLFLLVREMDDAQEESYIMFILDSESNCLLRYDPLVKKTLNENYKEIYSSIFYRNSKRNWEKKHLGNEINGISWLFCVEFGRRFTMVVEDQGVEWVIQNLMRGHDGGNEAFDSIEFELV